MAADDTLHDEVRQMKFYEQLFIAFGFLFLIIIIVFATTQHIDHERKQSYSDGFIDGKKAGFESERIECQLNSNYYCYKSNLTNSSHYVYHPYINTWVDEP